MPPGQDAGREFWLELADAPIERVIFNGIHYTMHEPGTCGGFGGAVFRIDWWELGCEPTECNLMEQGRIPDWIRERLRDNARAITDLEYSVNQPTDDSGDDDVPW